MGIMKAWLEGMEFFFLLMRMLGLEGEGFLVIRYR